MSETTSGPIRMRRGMLWLLAGSALLMGTYAFSTNEVNRILAYGLLVVGLYLAVLGFEKLIGGYISGARTGDPETIRAVRRTGAIGLLIVAIVAAGGYGVYSSKVPYWDSIEAFTAGTDSAFRLFDIVEGHTEGLESGMIGEYGLQRWKESAEAGLATRAAIADALEGARYLAVNAEGDLRSQAETFEPFYAVCMEWIDFYERIDRAFEEESMIEPKDEWEEEHERLHQKLHDVQPYPIEGS